MKVTVRSIGRLATQVPPGRSGNRVALELPEGATPETVLRRLRLSTDRDYLVLVNGEIVPQTRHARATLRDNDEVTILPKPKVG